MGYPLRDTLALIARRCVRRSRALTVDMRLGAVGASERAQRPADLSDTGLTIMLRPRLWLSCHLKVGDYKLPDRAVPDTPAGSARGSLSARSPSTTTLDKRFLIRI